MCIRININFEDLNYLGFPVIDSLKYNFDSLTNFDLGNLIRSERAKSANVTKTNEAELLIKAIRINTMSKLTFPDMRKFVGLMSDVFPGIQSEDIIYGELTAAAKQVVSDLRLDYLDGQIQKVL